MLKQQIYLGSWLKNCGLQVITYNFVAYLKPLIPPFPQQNLLGVQVGHLVSLKKGILNNKFFLACVICVVHIGILGRARAKELCSLGLYGPLLSRSAFLMCVHPFLMSLSIFSDLILQISHSNSVSALANFGGSSFFSMTMCAWIKIWGRGV